MNSGLCAAITGRACSRCTRPSTLSSSTASTFESSVAMSGTNSTSTSCALFGVLIHAAWRCFPRRAAAFVCRHHARRPATWSGRDASSFSSCVNAGTCEVSVPIIPMRMSAAATQSAPHQQNEDELHFGHCTLSWRATSVAMDLSTPLTYIKGVGPARAAMLEAKGLRHRRRPARLRSFSLRRPQQHENHRAAGPRRDGDGDGRSALGQDVGFQAPQPGVVRSVASRDSSRAMLAGKWFHGGYLANVLAAA